MSQPFRYTSEAIESYISEIVSDLKFPMTDNLLASRLAEMGNWFEMLRNLEALNAQPEQVTA